MCLLSVSPVDFTFCGDKGCTETSAGLGLGKAVGTSALIQNPTDAHTQTLDGSLKTLLPNLVIYFCRNSQVRLRLFSSLEGLIIASSGNATDVV